MPAKILICEDNELIAELISESFLSEGYKPIKLAKERNPDYILDNIEEVVKKENPDFAIIDGLDGKVYSAIESAKKANPEIIPIIFSLNEPIIEESKKLGYCTFSKKCDIDEIIKFIEEKK